MPKSHWHSHQEHFDSGGYQALKMILWMNCIHTNARFSYSTYTYHVCYVLILDLFHKLLQYVLIFQFMKLLVLNLHVLIHAPKGNGNICDVVFLLFLLCCTFWFSYLSLYSFLGGEEQDLIQLVNSLRKRIRIISQKGRASFLIIIIQESWGNKCQEGLRTERNSVFSGLQSSVDEFKIACQDNITKGVLTESLFLIH